MDIQERLARIYSSRALRNYKKILNTAQAFRNTSPNKVPEDLATQFLQAGNDAHRLAVAADAIELVLKKNPFDTQLLGASALIDRKLVEMKTGEGKTLTVGLAAAVLSQKGPVHVVTSNEYLAYRDAHLLAPVFNLLGISVGLNLANMSVLEKQMAYGCDVMYTTANELGFDYLRDNTAMSIKLQVQRERKHIIVDEADFLMIDEARVPMILSGQGQDTSAAVKQVWNLVKGLDTSLFEVELKRKQAALKEEGYQKLERALTRQGLIPKGKDLYQAQNTWLLSVIQACANIRFCFEKGKDYVIRDGEIKLVDEGTGRIMEGKRWSNFLHSAAEIKEGLEIQSETSTKASITLHSYLAKYTHVCGLTGTAMTESEEFEQAYGLSCVMVPTKKPVIRQDLPDRVFITRIEKLSQAVLDIQGRLVRRQPILAACESIDEALQLSKLLNKARIAHQVLDGTDPEAEAAVIAKAGMPGMVTVTTQVAGRGTDIVLGGPEDSPEHSQLRAQVLEAGGLHVLFTCANPSRRVDNQLRGRAGRQGDPGSSQRYASLEDALPSAFGTARLVDKLSATPLEGAEISGALIRKCLNEWQMASERQGASARKELRKYDQAQSDQRDAVYELRQALLENKVPQEYFTAAVATAILIQINQSVHFNEYDPNWPAIENELQDFTGLELPLERWLDNTDPEHYQELLESKIEPAITQILPVLRYRHLMHLDTRWEEYLVHLEGIKEGIGLQAYAQKNPATAFKEMAFAAFSSFRTLILCDLITQLGQDPEVNESEQSQPSHTKSDKPELVGPELAA